MRSQAPVEYNHTLNTVWSIAFERLSSSAPTLQNLLVFFDPDAIQERLLTNTKAALTDHRLEILI